MTPASRPPTFLLRRVVAAVVDSLLIASVWFGACAVFFMLGVGFASDLADLLLLGLVTVAFAGGIGQVIAWLYEAAFVSSRLEATPGKAIVGLRVVDAEGNRVGFGRATGRYWAKALTYIVFAVGSGVVAGEPI